MEINNYDEVIDSRYYNQPIKIECIVVGKSLTPYQIPKLVNVKCVSEDCEGRCGFQQEVQYCVNACNQDILRFIDIATSKISGVLKSIMGIGCKYITYEIAETQLIERIFVARATGKERTKKGGGSRPAYLVGDTIEANNIYHLEGYTTVDPVSQSVTHVFTHTEKQTNDAESFNLSIKKHSELNEFCIKKDDTSLMFEKLTKLYESYAHNITKIYEREDLHMCVDLLFRSVISFQFDNEIVKKGWMETMIVGDTRCGKGYVAEKLMEYFGVGEVVNGENTSFAGLVGGLQQLNKHWVITWGKIPMNDCGVLIVDESAGMDENMWGKLSRIRSEGIAEITKIQTETANARTRLIWICNPPNRLMSSYTYGIQSTHDLIKAPEDIARLDYVLAVAHDEVSGKVINQSRKLLPIMHSPELEQELIMWCWSRKLDEVVFEDEAIKYIYMSSIKLENLYDFSIPLIQVENVRFKLAKMAIAFAARFYSNIENGKKLLVKKSHVECSIIFLGKIYGKEASGYREYSIMKKSEEETATPKKLEDIGAYFNRWVLQKRELMRFLLNQNTFDAKGIMEHLGCVQTEAVECISKLLIANCIAKRRAFYVKTQPFVKYLKDIIMHR
jgi:hypothetical protein